MASNTPIRAPFDLPRGDYGSHGQPQVDPNYQIYVINQFDQRTQQVYSLGQQRFTNSEESPPPRRTGEMLRPLPAEMDTRRLSGQSSQGFLDGEAQLQDLLSFIEQRDQNLHTLLREQMARFEQTPGWDHRSSERHDRDRLTLLREQMTLLERTQERNDRLIRDFFRRP